MEYARINGKGHDRTEAQYRKNFESGKQFEADIIEILASVQTDCKQIAWEGSEFISAADKESWQNWDKTGRVKGDLSAHINNRDVVFDCIFAKDWMRNSSGLAFLELKSYKIDNLLLGLPIVLKVGQPWRQRYFVFRNTDAIDMDIVESSRWNYGQETKKLVRIVNLVTALKYRVPTFLADEDTNKAEIAKFLISNLQ